MRYRGYGKDKVQYVEDVGARKYEFRVLHNAFAIHRYWLALMHNNNFQIVA
jgi:hypothetical protein